MAAIERKLVLVDKFTHVFDKFILQLVGVENAVERQGEKAEKATEKTASRILEKVKALKAKIVAAVGTFTSFLQAHMDRVPDDILRPFNKIKEFFENTLGRVVTSFFKGAQKGFERFEQALKNPSVQKAIKILQVAFEAVGAAIGFVAEKLAEFVVFFSEQVGDATDFLAKALEYAGGAFGVLYVTVNNIFAAIWNAIAAVAEFIANVFNDPVGAVVRLFVGLGSTVLDILMVITRGIDKIFKTDWTSTLKGWQASMNDWAEEKYANNGLKIDRMETISYDEVEKFSAAGRRFGERLTAANLEKEQLAHIKSIDSGVGMIADAITDEDLKMLIDVATQKFVSNVNLTAQTPVITINGANTGNTDADRRTLANTIKDILVEQIASGSTSGQYSYMGA